jgi:Family of unknown function (DUF5996)
MTLPRLDHWTETSFGLHRGVLLLGALQRLTQPPQPAYLELGLQVVANGLAAGRLPAGGRVVLDFNAGSLVYSPASGAEVSFPLNGSSQAQIFAGLFGVLSQGELSALLPDGASLAERLSAGIASRGERYRPPRPETLWDETTIKLDARSARTYLEALQLVFTAIARFRARLAGMQTPLVVWPEHFDLSTLWFRGAAIDEGQPHLNFGFAPFSDGLPDPYLYAYAYPYPQRYDPPPLPAAARWHTQGWTGVVLPYGAIADQSDPAAFVEEACQAIYSGLLALLAG